MIEASTAADLAEFRASCAGTVGFVPTMGALHAGHEALIKTARETCDHVVVSIFVNPTQFAPNEDFASYPRNHEVDIATCMNLGVHALFVPTEDVIYPAGDTNANYEPNPDLASVMCGKSRPHFFYGVCNVVERLFRLVAPTHAFFGDKDLQQRVVIEHMVADLDLGITIVPCPIVRDEKGMALSSRNDYLDDEGYERALNISRALHDARQHVRTSQWSTHRVRQFLAAELEGRGLKGDYVEVFRPASASIVTGEIQPGDYCCVAVVCDTVRLIDNISF